MPDLPISIVSCPFKGGVDFDVWFGLVAPAVGAYFGEVVRRRFGGEWRLDASIGKVTRLAGEWYQPIEEDRRWFVAPRLTVERVMP